MLLVAMQMIKKSTDSNLEECKQNKILLTMES